MAEEANAVNDQVVQQDTTATDSAPVETKQPEVADPVLEALQDEPSTAKQEGQPKDTVAAPAEDAPAKPEEDTAEVEAKDEPQKEDPDAPKTPKSENRFQKLANENRQLKEQVEQLTSQVYAPQTSEDIQQEVNPDTGEQYTAAEARIAAFEQRQELRDYNDKVAEAQLTVGRESQQIIQSYPIFNPNSPEYKPEIAQPAARALEANLIRDPNVAEIDPYTGQPTGKGIVVGYHAPPSLIYQPIVDAMEMSKVEGQISGQQATASQLSRVDAPSSTTPAKPKVDPVLAILQSDED